MIFQCNPRIKMAHMGIVIRILCREVVILIICHTRLYFTINVVFRPS
jgi:hypothetical protein